MNLDELQRLVDDGESSVLEYKETTGQRVEACRTLCAFLNGQGGEVIFGVSRKGKVIGQFVSDETKKDLARVFCDFEPGVDVSVGYVKVNDEKTAIVCHVEAGTNKPYVYDGKPYRRIESTTTRMPQDMYNSMLRQRMENVGESDFSAEVCHGVSMSDMDPQAIAVFKNRWAKKSGEERVLNLSDEQVLRDGGVMRRNGDLTYAALVLFGKAAAIREVLPCAEYVFEYRQDSASGPADERKSYRDAFFNIYDQLWDRINLRNTKQHYQDGMFVLDLPAFNERVVREGLLNAVAHRNYRMQGYVLIRQYPQVLKIENPGGFPLGVDESNLLDCSAPRNRLIAEVLELAGLVERSGQGVNIMFEMSVREAKALPDYSQSDVSNVRLEIGGLLLDPALLRMVQLIEDRTLALFNTSDFLVLHSLANGDRLSSALQKRVPRLQEFGLIEKIERGHYVLSRRYYIQKGEPGVHTRRVGLVAEECKALIVKHVRLSQDKGVPGFEFADMLQGTPERRVKYFLNQLKKDGSLRVIGHGRGARWFLGVAELNKTTENRTKSNAAN